MPLLALIALIWTAAAAPITTADPDAWLDAVVLLTAGPGLCAGVLIDDAGTVATAYHCVTNGRRPLVEARDGTEGVGEVVTARPREDLAIIEVSALADRAHLAIRSDVPRIGEDVWALGHPFGTATARPLEGTLRWSVSRGIVSANGERMLQTDAGVNPGNSGGPVVDAEGRIVGITSRKLRGDNVAFAATAALLQELLDDPAPFSPLGGQYGLGIVVAAPTALGTAPSAGVEGRLMVRDRLVLSAATELPLGARWVALRRGEARWVSAETWGAFRVRVGRGAFSSYLDVGGGALAISSESAGIEDEQVWILPSLPTWRPGAVARLGFGGSALRWIVFPEDDGTWQVWIGMDLEWPGVLGIF